MENIEVFIPDEIVACLRFPTGLVRYRRDNQLFLDYFRSVAYIRREEKKEKRLDTGTRYIFCDADDYAIAYRIFCDVMRKDAKFPEEDLAEITPPEEMTLRMSEA